MENPPSDQGHGNIWGFREPSDALYQAPAWANRGVPRPLTSHGLEKFA